MSTNTAARRTGAHFSVSLRAPISLDEVACELDLALRTTLERSDERGLEGDWQGEALGLRLWLFVAAPPGPGVLPRYALIGSPEHDCPPDVQWPDISDHVSEALRARTGRAWTPSKSATECRPSESEVPPGMDGAGRR